MEGKREREMEQEKRSVRYDRRTGECTCKAVKAGAIVGRSKQQVISLR